VKDFEFSGVFLISYVCTSNDIK